MNENIISYEEFLELENHIENPKELKFNGKTILVYKYASNIIKTYIANTLCDIYFSKITLDDETESELFSVYHAIFVNLLVTFYTNIKLSDEFDKDSNIIVKTGLYDKILEIIPKSEIDLLKEKINMTISKKQKKIDYENSIENQLNNFLTLGISKIPDDKEIKTLLKQVKKEVNNFKPEKLEVINKVLTEFGEKKLDTNKIVEVADNILNDMGVKNGKNKAN